MFGDALAMLRAVCIRYGQIQPGFVFWLH
jgi:hypothetical protein